MLTGGSFRNEKFILAAESDADAIIIKSGLCGKSDLMSLAPYGNKLNVSITGNTIIFKKHSGRPLTYEEAHTLIKKIQLFEKAEDKMVGILQREARMHLKAPLTLFYPSASMAVIQVAFSYNWVAFETENKNFTRVLPALHDAILMEKRPSVLKVFSNDSNTVSIHNYDMGGVYVPRGGLEVIATALVENKLISAGDKALFVTRTAAFGVHTVTYMDARQLCQNVDETFDITDDKNYNPLIGNQAFLTPILESFELLAESGNFSKLDKDQVATLRSILVTPESLKQYGLSETIGLCITSFVQDFKDEIADAHRKFQ